MRSNKMTEEEWGILYSRHKVCWVITVKNMFGDCFCSTFMTFFFFFFSRSPLPKKHLTDTSMDSYKLCGQTEQSCQEADGKGNCAVCAQGSTSISFKWYHAIYFFDKAPVCQTQNSTEDSDWQPQFVSHEYAKFTKDWDNMESDTGKNLRLKPPNKSI